MFARFATKHGPWIIPALLALGSVGLAYSDMSNRVTAVETQQHNDGASIQRVEGKVDKVDTKADRIYDKLIEWERAK